MNEGCSDCRFQTACPEYEGKGGIMDDKKLTLPLQDGDMNFYKQVSDLLAAARQFAKRQLDKTIVTAYYEIGRMIVEREQLGQKRAQYGAKLIKGLSEYLTVQYGRGFSVANLQSIRKFYQIYTPSIQQTLSAKSENEKPLLSIFDPDLQKEQTPSAKFNLTWSHYQILSLKKRMEVTTNEAPIPPPKVPV